MNHGKYSKRRSGRSKAKGVRKRPAGGFITSLHVQDPTMLACVQKAAKARGESTSKFMLRVAHREALIVLNGDCPACGAPMKRHEKEAAA
jgi:hypothetical protein